ncbi:hypothetical protein [Billgrantia antri]|uniref:Uncharacterized protein n=1 Tax=Billgrantia antri TaxID=2846777 RepID=A0ABS6ZPT5_9GAMM|nr:hypothetical protein [Halomonas antri]MBW6391808.1 hypothetical protein [Halomonas antri]
MNHTPFLCLYDGRKSQRIVGFLLYVVTMLGILGYALGTLPLPIWLILAPSVFWSVWYVGSILVRIIGWFTRRAR